MAWRGSIKGRIRGYDIKWRAFMRSKKRLPSIVKESIAAVSWLPFYCPWTVKHCVKQKVNTDYFKNKGVWFPTAFNWCCLALSVLMFDLFEALQQQFTLETFELAEIKSRTIHASGLQRLIGARKGCRLGFPSFWFFCQSVSHVSFVSSLHRCWRALWGSNVWFRGHRLISRRPRLTSDST